MPAWCWCAVGVVLQRSCCACGVVMERCGHAAVLHRCLWGWCPAGMVVVWSLLVLVGCWSSVWVVLEWCLLWCLGSCAGL